MNKYKRIMKSYLFASITILFVTSSTSGGFCYNELRVRKWGKLDLEEVKGFDVPPDKGQTKEPDKEKEPDKPKRLRVGYPYLQAILANLQDGDKSTAKQTNLAISGFGNAFVVLAEALGSKDPETIAQLDEIIKLLKDNGTDINGMTTPAGRSPIVALAAATDCIADQISKFIANGADITKKATDGWSAIRMYLHMHEGNYNSSIARLLANDSVVLSDREKLVDILTKKSTRQQAILDLLPYIGVLHSTTLPPNTSIFLYDVIRAGYDRKVVYAILDKMKAEISTNGTSRKYIVENVLLITTAYGGKSEKGHKDCEAFMTAVINGRRADVFKDKIKRELSSALSNVFGARIYNSLNKATRKTMEDELADLICNAP